MPEVDTTVAGVAVQIRGQTVPRVLLDGGSGVNIISEIMAKELGITEMQPAPFAVKMADQRRVRPLGIVRQEEINIEGCTFPVTFIVLRMEQMAGAYKMLLGRPWLRHGKIKQNWQTDEITIRKGKKKIRISVKPTNRVRQTDRLLYAEGLNLLEGIEEDEEERILRENPDLVSLFEVDIDSILSRYAPAAMTIQPIKEEAQIEQSDEQDSGDQTLQELQRWIESGEAKHILSERSIRVKEDDLIDMNVGTTDDPKILKVSTKLKGQIKEELHCLLKEYKDVFAWSYSDMEGIDPSFYQHRINLRDDAAPIRQQRYRMNPNYARQVKEEIDRLLAVGFIYPIEKANWLSPIVIVSKKNGKLRVCVDYRKLNAATVSDPFPIPFTDLMLDAVAGHEMYSFLDGFSGYNQVRMAFEDREKTAFITEWGAFASNVMMFGLKNAPATFQRMVQEIFYEYLTTFMRVFVDDFSVFGKQAEHLHQLMLCLEKCRQSKLKLNPAKCAFGVTSGVLLGHIVSKDGLAVDPRKVEVIRKLRTPSNIKELSRFLGQIKWHTRFMRYLSHIAYPLYALTKKRSGV